MLQCCRTGSAEGLLVAVSEHLSRALCCDVTRGWELYSSRYKLWEPPLHTPSGVDQDVVVWCSARLHGAATSPRALKSGVSWNMYGIGKELRNKKFKQKVIMRMSVFYSWLLGIIVTYPQFPSSPFSVGLSGQKGNTVPVSRK